jgi:hypothetical protein
MTISLDQDAKSARISQLKSDIESLNYELRSAIDKNTAVEQLTRLEINKRFLSSDLIWLVAGAFSIVFIAAFLNVAILLAFNGWDYGRYLADELFKPTIQTQFQSLFHLGHHLPALESFRQHQQQSTQASLIIASIIWLYYSVSLSGKAKLKDIL